MSMMIGRSCRRRHHLSLNTSKKQARKERNNNNKNIYIIRLLFIEEDRNEYGRNGIFSRNYGRGCGRLSLHTKSNNDDGRTKLIYFWCYNSHIYFIFRCQLYESLIWWKPHLMSFIGENSFEFDIGLCALSPIFCYFWRFRDRLFPSKLVFFYVRTNLSRLYILALSNGFYCSTLNKRGSVKITNLTSFNPTFKT